MPGVSLRPADHRRFVFLSPLVAARGRGLPKKIADEGDCAHKRSLVTRSRGLAIAGQPWDSASQGFVKAGQGSADASQG
jgi:hypothetical protein